MLKLYLKYWFYMLMSHIALSSKNRKKKRIKKKNVHNIIHLVKDIQHKSGKETVFVIGDSHTDIFTKNTIEKKKIIWGNGTPEQNLWVNTENAPDFIAYHVGPCLAYSTNSRHSSQFFYEKLHFLLDNGFFPDGCRILTVFGEIDCRVHVKKQAEKQNKTEEEIVDEIIRHYGEFITMLKNRGYRVTVYAPIASQKETVNVDPEFPRYGSEIERNSISILFGRKMAEFCQRGGVRFVSIINKLLNSNLTTKGEYYRDGVHLNLEAFPFIEEIKEKI